MGTRFTAGAGQRRFTQRLRCATAESDGSSRNETGWFSRPQEAGHIGGELGMVLEQEAVGRVGVDLYPRLRDEACQ
jgi:hypothetical protein